MEEQNQTAHVETSAPDSSPSLNPASVPAQKKSKLPLIFALCFSVLIITILATVVVYLMKGSSSKQAAKIPPTPTAAQNLNTPLPTTIPTPTIKATGLCSTDADCGSDSKCVTSGPIIAGQTPQKICVKKGAVVPL